MATIAEEVRERGFAFRTQYHPDLSDETLALRVGVPVALRPGSAVHALTPGSTDQRSPNTYSGIYGLRAFPMHTDLAHHRVPPRYFLLRCRVPVAVVGTMLMHSADIVAAVGGSLLSRALVQPRRPRAGIRPLLRLFDPALELFRWDIEFVRPASDVGANAVSAVMDVIERLTPKEVRLERPGDLLVIDNWRMLHGRTAVPSTGLGRRIERIYLENLL